MYRADEREMASARAGRRRGGRSLARNRPPTDRGGHDQEAAEREAGLKKLPPGMVAMRDLHAVWP